MNDGDNQTASCPLLLTGILHIELHSMADSFKFHHIATSNICEMRIAGGLEGKREVNCRGKCHIVQGTAGI